MKNLPCIITGQNFRPNSGAILSQLSSKLV